MTNAVLFCQQTIREISPIFRNKRGLTFETIVTEVSLSRNTLSKHSALTTPSFGLCGGYIEGIFTLS